MRQLSIKFERRELGAPNAKFSEFAEKLEKEQRVQKLEKQSARQQWGPTGDPTGFVLRRTKRVLADAMGETPEQASKRRSALKYEYFRQMTPRGNI